MCNICLSRPAARLGSRAAARSTPAARGQQFSPHTRRGAICLLPVAVCLGLLPASLSPAARWLVCSVQPKINQ